MIYLVYVQSIAEAICFLIFFLCIFQVTFHQKSPPEMPNIAPHQNSIAKERLVQNILLSKDYFGKPNQIKFLILDLVFFGGLNFRPVAICFMLRKSEQDQIRNGYFWVQILAAGG